MLRFVTVSLFCLLPTLLLGRSLSIGGPVEARIVGEDQMWQAQAVKMTVDSKMVTGLSSGENHLYLFDEQRDTLIQYLIHAQGWQKTGEGPNLSEEEIYQICEGKDSRGAFGLVRCSDGVPYVVMILADRDMSLKSGLRCFLTKQTVREMILKLENAPIVYQELQDRVERARAAAEAHQAGEFQKRNRRLYDYSSIRG